MKVCMLICILIIVSSIDATTVAILADNEFHTLDQTVTISISVDQVSNLYAFACDLVYDPNIIGFESIFMGQFINDNGNVPTSYFHNLAYPGRLIIAISRIGNYSGATTNTDTTIMGLTFSPMAFGITYLQLENVGLMDPELNFIPFDICTDTVRIVGNPQIQGLQPITLELGETFSLNLLDYVYDPDTPVSDLVWSIDDSGFLNTDIDEWNNLHITSESTTGYCELILSVSDGFFVTTDSIAVTVLAPVSVNEQEDLASIRIRNPKIYPNPCQDAFVIETTQGKLNQRYRIYNSRGQLVQAGLILNDRSDRGVNSVSLGSLPNGLYILKFENNEPETYKLMIRK